MCVYAYACFFLKYAVHFFLDNEDLGFPLLLFYGKLQAFGTCLTVFVPALYLLISIKGKSYQSSVILLMADTLRLHLGVFELPCVAILPLSHILAHFYYGVGTF